MDLKSYLMGVFDGEGSVNTYQQRGRWTLTVGATIANRTIVDLFQQTWGGGVHVRKRPTAGGLTLCQWFISASKAIPFLEYATVNSMHRQRRFEIALELARSMAKYADPATRRGHNIHDGGSVITPEDRARREQLVLELRALNGGRSRFDPAFVPAPLDLPAPRRPEPVNATREQLLELYVVEGLSARMVGERLGLSQDRVLTGLRAFGIPRRGPTTASRQLAWQTRRARQAPA